MELYILYLNTVYFDMETHSYSDVIGVFSSIEKAKKAYSELLNDYIDEDGEFCYDHADEWSFDIFEYELDRRGEGVHVEELLRGEAK